ncbi:MAG TPA: DUF3068 domain-containing protein [Kribbellaceae bacterium]|nr:DUF3068 domain-containing protein [Kribbellaceae bacterium]
MGNRSRAALVAGGVFLVGVAALSRFYAYPTLAVAPADQVTQVIADGPGARIFDVATLKEITIDLQAVRNIRGDVAASEQASKDLDRDVVVYDMSIVTDKPGYVLPDDAKQTDNWPRSFSQQRMVLDARTGEAVSWKPQDPKQGEYLSTKIEDTDDARDYADDKGPEDGRPVFEGHKGLVLKFPAGTEKKDYEFWEANTRQAWPIKYESEEKVLGLNTYKFVQEVPTTKIAEIAGVPRSALKLPGEGSVTVDRDYASTRTIWVEPLTGAIINASDKQYSTLKYEGETRLIATDATFTYTDETVKKNVEGVEREDTGEIDGGYQDKAAQLNLIKNVIPLTALILGVLLIALAGFLQARPTATRARRGGGGDDGDDAF